MIIPRGRERDCIAQSTFTAALRIGCVIFGLFAAMTSHPAEPAATARRLASEDNSWRNGASASRITANRSASSPAARCLRVSITASGWRRG